MPVIETGVGNCHVYVDAAADLDKALAILLNAKTQRLSTCNAAESLLVHARVADAFLPPVLAAFAEAGVTVHGDARGGRRTPPTWSRPPRRTSPPSTCRADISAAVVDSLDAAVAHIRRYGTGHTEAIVTGSQRAPPASSWPGSTRRR